MKPLAALRHFIAALLALLTGYRQPPAPPARLATDVLAPDRPVKPVTSLGDPRTRHLRVVKHD